MIGDEASVDHTCHLELGGVDAGDLTDILVRHPHFLEIGRELQEWRERTRHRNTLDHLMARHIDDVHFGRKARYHECCPAILLKQHHAGTRCGLDAAYLLESVRVDHRDVVLASNNDPHFLAVGGEEALVRRPPDVSDALNLVGRGIDERHRVGAIGNGNERLVIRREAQAVNIDLTFVQRRQNVRTDVTEPYLTEKLVGRRVDHRHRVGVLIGCVDAVLRFGIGEREIGDERERESSR